MNPPDDCPNIAIKEIRKEYFRLLIQILVVSFELLAQCMKYHTSNIPKISNISILIAKVLNEMPKLKPPFQQKMPFIKRKAVLKFGARKKIQQKDTNTNVNMPPTAFDNQYTYGNGFRPLMAFSSSCSRPCSPPHVMNVQFAPCQRPLTRKTVIILQQCRNFEHRLPPKEM